MPPMMAAPDDPRPRATGISLVISTSQPVRLTPSRDAVVTIASTTRFAPPSRSEPLVSRIAPVWFGVTTTRIQLDNAIARQSKPGPRFALDPATRTLNACMNTLHRTIE
jgi:hypothetical protein